jgi:hypothetical protein
MEQFLRLFRALIAECEIHLQKDSTGWRFSAKGALGIAVFLVIVLLLGHLSWLH